MRDSRRLFRRGSFLVVSLALGASGAACLPDVDFESPDGGGIEAMSDTGTPPVDARADATSDAGSDATTGEDGGDATMGVDGNGATDASVDGVTDGATEADADPNAIGPFVTDLEEHDGFEGACAVKAGQLYCWGGNGSNLSGQLGFPPDQQAGPDYPVPTEVTSTAAAASTITAIAMGSNHMCTLYGRTVYCRGDNQFNELGNNGGATGPTESAVQGIPSGGLDLIAAAQISTCGVTLSPAAGSVSNVYCWGENGEGELARPIGTEPTLAVPVTGEIDGGPLGAIDDAIAIAGGGYHFCAVSQSRGILCWGSTTYMESGTAVGTSTCPGNNAAMCTDQPSPVALPNGEVPTGVAVGAFHSCALTQSGHVYCWGWNLYGALGSSATLTRMCTDGAETTGCTGTPVQATVSNITKLRAGGSTTCAIDTSHHAWCWGNDDAGQVGHGDDNDVVGAPLELEDPNSLIPYTFDDISVGYEATCGRNGDSLYCWGGGVLGTAPADAGGSPFTESPALVLF